MLDANVRDRHFDDVGLYLRRNCGYLARVCQIKGVACRVSPETRAALPGFLTASFRSHSNKKRHKQDSSGSCIPSSGICGGGPETLFSREPFVFHAWDRQGSGRSRSDASGRKVHFPWHKGVGGGGKDCGKIRSAVTYLFACNYRRLWTAPCMCSSDTPVPEAHSHSSKLDVRVHLNLTWTSIDYLPDRHSLRRRVRSGANCDYVQNFCCRLY